MSSYHVLNNFLDTFCCRSSAKADNPEDVLKMYDDVEKDMEKSQEEKSKEKVTDYSKPSKKKRYPKLGNYNEFTVYERAGWPGKVGHKIFLLVCKIFLQGRVCDARDEVP